MSMRDECYSCESKRSVPGNCHIMCANPDPEMQGDPHGKKNGWFIYPLLFDPVWKQKDCSNYKAKDQVNPVSGVISQAISQATRG